MKHLKFLLAFLIGMISFASFALPDMKKENQKIECIKFIKSDNAVVVTAYDNPIMDFIILIKNDNKNQNFVTTTFSKKSEYFICNQFNITKLYWCNKFIIKERFKINYNYIVNRKNLISMFYSHNTKVC